jgi:hypothetical protein
MEYRLQSAEFAARPGNGREIESEKPKSFDVFVNVS